MSRMPFADTLALHEDFVRGLARGVLGLDDRVEDIVQETWRIALQKAPRQRSRLRGWLAVVARNRAISLLRKDAARRKHESAVRPGAPAPAAGEIAAREETRRLLVEALLRLPEPYREALLLRYYEALGPKEIARRLGLPRDTVKSRLRRGLKRLRGELRGRNLVALAPLALARRSWAAWFWGVVIMKTQLKIALAVLAVAATGLLGWQVAGDRTPPRADSAARTPPAAGTGSGVAATAAEQAGEGPRPRAAPAEDARLLLRGELVADGARVRGAATIEARGVQGLGLTDESVRGESADDGVFALAVAPMLDGSVRQLVLRVDHPRYMPKEALVSLRADGEPEHAVVELAPAAVVEGVVLRPDGTPATEAEASVYVREGPRASAVDHAKVDANGRYRLRVGADGRYWLVASEARLRPAARHEELRVRQARSAAPLRLREGVTISGRLLVNGGPPPPGTFVKANYRGPGLWGRNVVLHDEGTEVGDARARVGTDGRFVCEGLAPARYWVRCVGLRSSHMSVYQGRHVEVTAPASGVEIRIERAELVIEVTGEGVPRERAMVWLHGEGTSTAHTDEHGRFTTHVRPGLAYTLEIKSVDGFDDHSETVVVEHAGERRVLSVALRKQQPRATLVVRVATKEGEPPHAIALGLFPEGSTKRSPRIRRTATREGGAAPVYRVDGLAPGAYRVVVRDGDNWFGALGYHLDAETRAVLTPGAESAVAVDLRLGGRLRLAAKTADGRYVQAPCELRDAEGETITAFYMNRGRGGFSGTENTLSMVGPSEIARALPAGRYAATISARGFVQQRIELTIEKGRTTVREVVLDPE